MGPPQKTPSPSPSTLFLPLGLRSRRGSRSSIVSPSQIDRETLSSALDKIHSSACQTETLTTFNDYSSPPPASSSSHSKTTSNEAQQSGLSGLYSRFRGAVSTSKDKTIVQDGIGPAESPTVDTSSISSQAMSKSNAPESEPPIKPNLMTKQDKANRAADQRSKDQRGIAKARAALPPILTTTNSISASQGNLPRASQSSNERQETRKGSVSGSIPSPHSYTQRPLEHSQASPSITDSDSSQVSELLMRLRDRKGQDKEQSSTVVADTDNGVISPQEAVDRGKEQTPSAAKLQAVSKQGILLKSKIMDERRSLNNIPEPGQGSKHAVIQEGVNHSHLPGFRLSRASSTDTAFSSLPDSPRLVKSQQGAINPQNARLTGRSNLGATTVATLDSQKVTANTLQEMGARVLSKDFWMKDENSTTCYRCQSAFTTWRRKHHCRTCGQIFDAKCTSLIEGNVFGLAGTLRVCKPCQNLIQGAQFDSDGSLSEDDDYRMFPMAKLRPDQYPLDSEKETNALSTPTMAIPTRRIGDGSNRRSAILEINPDDYLSRPASSRSVRTPLTGRPRSSSHRRHVRQQSSRSFKQSSEDRNPFHKTASEDTVQRSRLPMSHNDSIIDPDLAPYMSDEEATSEDEEMSLFATIESHSNQSMSEQDRQVFNSVIAASKRGRSRFADKSIGALSIGGRDFEDGSVASSKLLRMSRKRNSSFATLNHPRPTPRRSKSNLLLKGLGPGLSEALGTSPGGTNTSEQPHVSGFKMTRSASMRGSTAPAIELNSISLNHVRKLLRQLLQDAGIVDINGWEKSLIPILLRCTDDVSPDIRAGDDIDIRHYVKIKKIPGGKLGDTAYISGVVFGKNIALKSMSRSISYPRIVLIRSPIEYQRSFTHYMSLEPVIAQEKEALQNKVNRIQEFQPTLLLVQNNVAGVALDYLDKAKIATVHNIKQSVIEAVGRCCKADINSSIEMLALNQRPVGQSASFDVKTYVHKDIPGHKRTYIYLSGCAKELGCTIVLRGADMKTLAQVKRITEFMVYVVYNLKLETCLMRDEYVSIPTIAEMDAADEKAKLSKPEVTMQRQTIRPEDAKNMKDFKKEGGMMELDGILEANDSTAKEPSKDTKDTNAQSELAQTIKSRPDDENSVPDDVPMPTFYSDMVEKHQTKILSASPFVKFMQPYLLMRAREQERRLVYLKRLKDQDNLDDRVEKEIPQKFSLITPEMVHHVVKDAPRKVKEVIHAVHDAEYDRALYNYETQKRRWETYISGNVNLFDPFAHQNIVVLFTLICTSTTVPCIGPQILALRFYDEHETEHNDIFEPDCTLGQFVESSCLSGFDICSENGCEKPMSEHHRQYVCGEGQISVSLERQPCKLRGLQDSILMWSWCKICQKDTQVMPMSDSTWNYSFGKYLELSFWSSDLRLRANVCPHTLNRDHDRFFGFKDMAVRVQYTQISLLEVVVPRARITWKVDLDLKIKNEVYTQVEERLNKFMASVKARLKSIKIDSVLPEKSEPCKVEIEQLTKRANDEHQLLLRTLRDRYMGTKYYETIPLNKALRVLQEKSIEWDTAFANFDANFFPSEKDIRRLAALQLKKIFLDRDEAITIPIPETPDGVERTEMTLNEKLGDSGAIEIAPKPTQMSPEEANDVLTSVIEEDVGSKHDNAPAAEEAKPIDSSSAAKVDTLQPPTGSIDDVEHLDLAIMSGSPEKTRTSSPDAKRSTSPLSNKNARSSPRLTALQSVDISTPTGRRRSRDRQHQTGKESQTQTNSATPLTAANPAVAGVRRQSPLVPPTLNRAQSQPIHLQRDRSLGGTKSPLSNTLTPSSDDQLTETGGAIDNVVSPDAQPVVEKKFSDRIGLTTLKNSRKTGQSLIPRSVASKKKDSKVSTLAKHFEQLSREFEKERLRERRRAFLTRQSRAYPAASSKPIVEVYRTVKDAVEEYQSDDELDLRRSKKIDRAVNVDNYSPNGTAKMNGEGSDESKEQDPADTTQAEDTTADDTEAEDMTRSTSQLNSDAEGETSDIDHSFLEDVQIPDPTDASRIISPLDPSLDLKIDLPKHEKTSLMKMLTNFWAERSASGWTPLEYPLSPMDHVFADSNVIIREDEPSSVIALALDCHDYRAKLQSFSLQNAAAKMSSNAPAPEKPLDEQTQIEKTLHRKTDTHFSCGFKEGSATMFCKIFFAEQFDAVRKTCGVADRIVESLTRCLKWDSKGGKSKSVFLKTLDDRFVLKSLQTAETQAFLKFAPAYFQIMSKVFFQELPSAIAKMLGFFQVIVRNPQTGTDIKWDLLLMENLFYDRVPSRTFDLKGSMRNRKIQPTGEQNEVLLDENMVDLIFEKPLFAREHSKKLLAQSVFNDTLFLAGQQVMDYSLMVAIDDSRNELVVGIIDCIRTYTWDKKIEFWIKDRGFGGGGTRAPTVTSPKEYKSRFREAMARYVLHAPNCWHQFARQIDSQKQPLRKVSEGKDKESSNAAVEVGLTAAIAN